MATRRNVFDNQRRTRVAMPFGARNGHAITGVIADPIFRSHDRLYVCAACATASKTPRICPAVFAQENCLARSRPASISRCRTSGF